MNPPRVQIGFRFAICLFLGTICGACQALAQGESAGGLNFQKLTKARRSLVCRGEVCVLKGQLANNGTVAEEALLVATVNGRSDRQSVRAVRLEPGKQETCEIYVQIPEENQEEWVEIEIALKKTINGNEIILSRNGSPVIHQLRLPVDCGPIRTAYAFAPDPPAYPKWFWPPIPDHFRADYELAIGARVEANYSRQTITLSATNLPLQDAEWERTDLLMIADPILLTEGASVESVRRFLDRGGRVWIMLDQVPCELVRPFLAAEQACEAVDEVLLNEVVMELPYATIRFDQQNRTVASDEPLRMKRVVQSGGTVTHLANGWPASITMQVGRGELMLTTLDARAWMQPRSVQPKSEPLYQSTYAPRPWAKQHLADTMHVVRQEPASLDGVAYPLEHIGTSIVHKSWVAVGLVGFCVLLSMAISWRLYSGDLRLLGWLTPGIAVVSGSLLIASKALVSAGVPERVASLQIIEVARDGNYARVQEHSAAFLDSTSSMKLGFDADGTAQPSGSNVTGIQRLITTDFHQWNLSNIAWPSGLWRYQSDYLLETEQLVVTARITAAGCELDLPKDLPSSAEDVIIAYAPGSAMHCARAGDHYLADGKLRAGPQRWIADSLMTEEQRRRMSVYEQLLASENGHASRQSLYAWTELWDGPQWDQELPRVGFALAQLPVRLERPPAGQALLVPHGLIQLRQSPNEEGTSAVYQDATGFWQKEQTIVLDREFQFVLPPELIPFEAEAIELDLDIRAPRRRVTLSIMTRQGEVEIAKLDSPTIPWHADLQSPNILREFRDGVLNVRLKVGERTDLVPQSSYTSMVAWQVDYFNASVRGSVSQ